LPSAELKLQKHYTRTDPRGHFTVISGAPALECNRLGAFWRPIIDMTDSPVAPLRLQFISPVSAELADPKPGRISWFAIIGVPGLRHQVLRHAGLTAYDCREPTGLPGEFRTPRWQTLIDGIENFSELDYYTRSLVVFQLAQLSYCQFVFKIAGLVQPDGGVAHDRYAYDVARVHGRYPGHVGQALQVFSELAASSSDGPLALASCAQGIGHALRNGFGLDVAHEFAAYSARIPASALPDDWHTCLVRSRFHRAMALLQLIGGQADGMRTELAAAVSFGEKLFDSTDNEIDRQVALENKRIITESQIRGARRARGGEPDAHVRSLCAEILQLDPYCIEARLVAADGYAAIADYPEAAYWYAQAGELGTASGAVGWFRAAQCYTAIGDDSAALNAMGRCLELDGTAIEAQEYMRNFSSRRQVSSATAG
jgi:hypothetical protein